MIVMERGSMFGGEVQEDRHLSIASQRTIIFQKNSKNYLVRVAWSLVIMARENLTLIYV